MAHTTSNGATGVAITVSFHPRGTSPVRGLIARIVASSKLCPSRLAFFASYEPMASRASYSWCGMSGGFLFISSSLHVFRRLALLTLRSERCLISLARVIKSVLHTGHSLVSPMHLRKGAFILCVAHLCDDSLHVSGNVSPHISHSNASSLMALLLGPSCISWSFRLA